MRARLLYALAAVMGITACKGKSEATGEGPARPASAPEMGPRLYVHASTLHLRGKPAPEAQSLEKLPIGTECTALGPAEGDWRKVRCGAKEGFVAASLLGTEKPDLEQLKAEADNVQLTLAQRQDSALRAAMLAPEDPVRFTVLRERFLERNVELLAGAKKKVKGQPFRFPCFSEEAPDRCLAGAASDRLQGARAQAFVQKRRFVVAAGNAERIDVYRGRYTHDTEDGTLEGEVLERTSFAPPSLLEKALFVHTPDTGPDPASPRLGQLVLDAPSRALMEELPDTWALLERAEDDSFKQPLNECERRSFLLWLTPDVHGRWRLEAPRPGSPVPESYWVSSVTRREERLTLKLAREAGDEDGPVFEVPLTGSAPATLGGRFFASLSRRFERVSVPCGSEVAEAGLVSFDGAFTPEGAMRVLYGGFDTASGASRWWPTRVERAGFGSLGGFATRRFEAKPWKWATWSMDGAEKVLFLSETPSGEPVYHGSTALIGGGVFTKTDTGWRLETANRAITSMGSFGSAPGFDIIIHGVDGKGFVASLETGFTATGTHMQALLLLSNVGPEKYIRVVATMEDTGQSNEGSCEDPSEGESADDEEEGRWRPPECFSYDSTWALKDNAARELPDVVLTTQGTRLKEDSREVESFHEVRTLSFDRGGYR